MVEKTGHIVLVRDYGEQLNPQQPVVVQAEDRLAMASLPIPSRIQLH